MALKDDILAKLRAQSGEYVSGQSLAQTLGVTRSAVWKAITRLKEEGYVVSSSTNRGYLLCAGPDLLRADEIEYRLLGGGETLDVSCFETLDSTNLEARRRAAEKPLVIVANEQRAGRGRLSRAFYSPAGKGLYMTLYAPLSLPIQSAALATQAAAVAAARAVEKTGGPKLQIKWVNDLFLHGKKAGGILTEAIASMETGGVSALLCGIGLNLTAHEFPDALKNSACSVGPINRNILAANIALELLPLLRALPQAPWMPEYRARSMILSKRVGFTQNGAAFEGAAEAIDDEGRLVVRLSSGERMTLASGEVSVRPAGESEWV